MSSANEHTDESKLPEWAPQDGGAEFASRVISGVRSSHDGFEPPAPPKEEGASAARPHDESRSPAPRRRELSLGDYVSGILSGDRTIISRAITLVESNNPAHFELARQVVKDILPHSGNSARVGITGVPGAGKSTFIDALGMMLCKRDMKVAVLAVDPSSSVTKGSILGDKTRMEDLSKHKNAFIRPSPSGGTLGGLTRKSRETMLICEAAGYDAILVETVGVGQSEAAVRDMVDFFLLVVLTGAGDELQGIKKGVMELADAIVVNKADGSNVLKANATRAEYDRILHYLRPATEGWTTRAYTCSAATGAGIGDIWSVVMNFTQNIKASGVHAERRKQQTLSWVYAMVEDYLKQKFYRCGAVERERGRVENDVVAGELSATEAASELIRLFENSWHH
ncbi:MAG: methylmalonyl Co-A mutase-associated GTPase MeaB [Synergistaceae bacterium]|nr:methylmalonyl Co-A mutase-associated GTPase MeaB [Synergistaceae bacterium]